MPRSTTLTIRMTFELLEELNKYSEILRLKPSTLANMILTDKMEEWVKEYAKKVYSEVID